MLIWPTEVTSRHGHYSLTGEDLVDIMLHFEGGNGDKRKSTANTRPTSRQIFFYPSVNSNHFVASSHLKSRNVMMRLVRPGISYAKSVYLYASIDSGLYSEGPKENPLNPVNSV